jgi:hypothetical protein
MEFDWNLILGIGEAAILVLFGYLVYKWNTETAISFKDG